MVRLFASAHMSPSTAQDAEAPDRRQRWLSLLAKAPSTRLEALWDGLDRVPSYTMLRRPEIGLVMVQGAGVGLQSGKIAMGYVGGRKPRQAEIVAAIDALGHLPEWQEAIETRIVGPLAGGAEGRPPPPAA